MKIASNILAAFAACVLWLADASAAWPAEPAAGEGAARVVSLSGEVRAGRRELRVGDSVEGEEIASGRASYATFEFTDGSVVRIKPDTRLRIRAHRAMPAPGEFETGLRLDTGALEAYVTMRRAQSFSIASPSGYIAAHGAHFRARIGDEAMLVEVLEGSVAVAGISSARWVSVEEGYGTRVRAMAAPLSPVRLLAAPDISGIVESQHRPVVRLRFAPRAGAERYRIVAATDRDLHEMVVENMQRRPDVRMVDLRDAEYFFAVRAVDALGLEGPDARGRFRLKARPFPPAAQAPEADAVLQPGNVTFSWALAEEAFTYRFQLAADEDFTAPLVNRGGMIARELEVEKLEAGRYYWRVASVRPDGDEGPFGDPMMLTLQAPAPQLPQ